MRLDLESRILKLEARKGNVQSGKLPIAVIDRVVSQTISDAEFIRWLPVIEIMLSASEEGKACPDARPRRRIAHRDLRIATDITPYRSMARQGARVYIAGVN